MNTHDTRLDAALAGLASELPPARDLWPGIERELLVDAGRSGTGQRPGQGPGQRPGDRSLAAPMALAASVAMFALLGALAWNLRTQSPAPWVATVAGVQASGGARPVGTPVLAEYGQLDDSAYVAARAKLEAVFEERLALLAPATQARVRADIATIRSANADLRAALAKDPASPLLMQLLASTWRQEIDLYSSVARSTSPLIQRRTRT